ncbi:cbb3-type cytochrome c oxidase subunit I [Enteractinococcus coprophilus]|uniref:Uncharacterized protein n=1 Tax=Enteractinococcus coprophilus TaxID=1027633 RepID=A0A543ANP3_9MICC|nr:cbb3-type cytochrome c oxidase subunit I [Enteractinococcus coprophilus]TQL74200.1 hypothetical protein FB556_0654 [Enteractinococcus coprophilus]
MNTRGAWFMRDIPVILWLAAAILIALLSPVFGSSRWLVVHLIALGGFTHSIMVWSVYFANALLKTKDVDPRSIQNIRLTLLQVGILAVVIGVPSLQGWLTILGAVIISGVIIWHAATLLHRLRIALPGRFRISIRYYLVAAAFVPIGALFGVLLARGLPGDWHGKLLVAHTMVNLLGWVGLSIFGTLITLWPTMLRTKMADDAERTSIRALPVLAVGLMTIMISPLVDLTWLGVVGVGVYLTGTLITYRPMLQAARGRAPHSFPTFSASAALLWLPVALVTLAVKMLFDGWQVLPVSYGVLTVMFLVGFALQMLLGALSYLVPVVIGGGPRPLRAGMRELNRLGTWRVFTVNIALIVCLLPVPPLVRTFVAIIAILALALTLVCILLGILAMLRTKRQLAAEMAIQGIPPGGVPPRKPADPAVIHPKLSKRQVVGAVVTVALGAALGFSFDPSAPGLEASQSVTVAHSTQGANALVH